VNRLEQYASLVNWASESKSAYTLLPLPEGFDNLRFDPFTHVATGS
jgi:hypothetical protein